MYPIDTLELAFAHAVVAEGPRAFGVIVARPSLHTVPNLDAMSIGELRAFHMLHEGGRNRARAYKLIGDRRKNYTRITSSLACYASNKVAAMKCREEGNLAIAEGYEGICERIYKELPADLKW